MRLLKPSWVAHDGHPIFSLDIHPDCSRFVTGGQGADTGRVVIWNMAPIINESDENDENIPKMLCQMDNHLACVNCVRWSSNGKFLASGGDDKIVMIWQTGRYGSSTVFGSGGSVVNVEQWRCVNTLRGHSGDVLDLAWSPHDAWLASCSVDNTVVIWNAFKFPEMITVLKGHTGLVKGVTWDPVGKYLASQSDDKTLRVWRTIDWQQESVITEPFDECGGTTHVLRLSWSPDGQFLVSAHAMNNSGPTARIVERDGWKTDKDFVGHRKAVTCVRFNPNILCKTNENNKVHYFCCAGVGSRDRSLSVWLTSLKRPLVVIHDLFSNSVLDISWSLTGQQLMVCSWDGTVAFIEFEDDEIGKPLTTDEKNSFHQKMYGKSLAMTNQTSSMTTIIENPAMLKLKNAVKAEEELNDSKAKKEMDEEKPKTVVIKPVTPVKGPNKQIETITADGKRRITPCFIAPAPDIGDAPLPFSSRCQPTFSSSKEPKSKIIIEKVDESSSSQMTSSATRDSKFKGDSLNEIIVNGFSTKPQSLVNGGLSPSKESFTIKSSQLAEGKEKPTTIDSSDKAKEKIVKTPPVNVIAVKRKAESSSGQKPGDKRKPGRPPLSASTVTSTSATTAPREIKNDKLQSIALTTTPPSLSTSTSAINFPALKTAKSLTVQMQVIDDQYSSALELENNIPAASGIRLHKLRRVRSLKDAGKTSTGDIRVMWEVVLNSPCSAVAASSFICCVACVDCTLSVFSSKDGHRVFPPIILPSAVSRLTCKNYYMMVITTKGYVSVWDVKKHRCLMKETALDPLLLPSMNISNTGLTSSGSPVVSISNGKTYVFSTELDTWILISNIHDSLSLCSNHQKFIPENISVSSQPLASLQGKQSTRAGRAAGRIFATNPELQQSTTLSHLDTQLVSSLSLNSSKEYKFWLLTLVRFLAQEGMEARLRHICDDLIGPVVTMTNTDSTWEATVLGISKRDLLRESLSVIGTNLALQRLYTEYQEQLESIS